MIDKQQEKIISSLQLFYNNNSIRQGEYLSDGQRARTERKTIERFIGEDILEDNLIKWLNSFDEQDQKYLLKIFEKYTYITEREMEYMMYDLFTRLETQLGQQRYLMKDVLFITVESNVKSGGDNIREVLQKSNINRIIKGQIIAAVSRIDEAIIDAAQVIVFIDDIIGTGNTSYRNIKETCEKFASVNIKKKKIILACVCAKQNAINSVIKSCKKECIDIETIVCKPVQSCFFDDKMFEGKEKEEAIETIKKYEEMIDNASREDERTYYLGFKKSKLLLTFYYDTPNNTLCNFWRYSDISYPLFPRQTSGKMDIDALKEKKRINADNAYYAGAIKNENL